MKGHGFEPAPARAAGEFHSPGSAFCADPYFGIRFSHQVLLAYFLYFYIFIFKQIRILFSPKTKQNIFYSSYYIVCSNPVIMITSLNLKGISIRQHKSDIFEKIKQHRTGYYPC